jgi:hypothetical protein
VIAHVIDTTVLGYFILEEALHMLLDIGFIWTVYVDGEMGLLPQRVFLGDLEVTDSMRTELSADIDLMHAVGRDAQQLAHITPTPLDCVIKEVTFFEDGDSRRLLLTGEEGSLSIETSMVTAEIRVNET